MSHRQRNVAPGSPRGGVHDALATLLGVADDVAPSDLARVVTAAGHSLGARSMRLLVADYGLSTLHELGDDGPSGDRRTIAGTMPGRAFSTGDLVVSDGTPTVVWIPLVEGSERIGVLELTHDRWSDELRAAIVPVIRLLALLVVSKRRYTDVVLRSRRSAPLSVAAEIQWDLLPPLTCSTDDVSVSGILEPAYSIGGDSFDYALNPDGVEFAIVDAVGHGMSAVLMASVAINTLRNARREGRGLGAAYHDAGAVVEAQFGDSHFVTGQIGHLATSTGTLTWLNAGHPRPLLVRDGTFTGELACRPSVPMGLGGPVVEIATEHLQRGDRVLFYTDGVTETRSPAGDAFGVERLADHLVRATLDQVSPAETIRRLSASVLDYNGAELTDDATLLLVAYHPPASADPDISRPPPTSG